MKKKKLIGLEQRICNCSECGEELISWWNSKGECVGKKVERSNGRPLCDDCDHWRRRKPSHGHAATADDINPWQENAIRCLEEAL